jgi:enoyl-CoA hydratase
VLGSDIRIGAESARFAVSFVRAGFSGCDMGTSWLLARIVGAGNAHELLLTGRTIDAAEARSIGLLVDVVPDGTVTDAAVAKAQQVMENTPWGVALTKAVMWSTLEIPGLYAAVDMENRTQAMTTVTRDSEEARRAWVERRPPRFGYE